MKVLIKKMHPNARIPKRATEFAGGWDVVVTEIIKDAEDVMICKLGFCLEVPINYKIRIVPRSSITKTDWFIQNTPTLFDSDFRAEYVLKFKCISSQVNKRYYGEDYHEYYMSYTDFPYKEGDRIAQMYLEEVIPIEFEEITELSNTTRGEGSFGSTGVK